jgi:hypothetical protein
MASPRDPKVEAWFANLKPDDYEVRGLESPVYNCVAWAAGRNDAWWEPVRKAGYYWPAGVRWDDKLETLSAVFAGLGFEECADADPSPGYEKIAIYGEDGAFLHAARQIAGGWWTSKLGTYKEIIHKTLEALAGPAPAFVEVVLVMRRRI